MFVQTFSRGLGAAPSVGSAAVGAGISAGVSLATTAAGMWLNSINLSHQADTATTQIVNGLEPLLNKNKDAYLKGPGTCSDQAAALAAYDTAIQWLRSTQGCGRGEFGSAGNRCISDRIGAGARFPWDTWYRDPIANDPRASECSALLASTNPDAEGQSAVQNILNVISGNNRLTTGGMFAGSGSSGSQGAGESVSDTLATIPSWVWLAAGGVALFVAFK